MADNNYFRYLKYEWVLNMNAKLKSDIVLELFEKSTVYIQIWIISDI